MVMNRLKNGLVIFPPTVFESDPRGIRLATATKVTHAMIGNETIVGGSFIPPFRRRQRIFD
jgi:hypothetical protein